MEVPYGAIVSIFGSDLGGSKYPDRDSAPIFFSIVGNPIIIMIIR